MQNAQQVKEEETAMAKMYRTPLWQRLLNAFVKSLLKVNYRQQATSIKTTKKASLPNLEAESG